MMTDAPAHGLSHANRITTVMPPPPSHAEKTINLMTDASISIQNGVQAELRARSRSKLKVRRLDITSTHKD